MEVMSPITDAGNIVGYMKENIGKDQQDQS